MEPEIIALAHRMSTAFEDAEPDSVDIPLWDLEPGAEAWRRCCLRAAVLARPDLAAGVRVPLGHWAAGVLETYAIAS